LLFRKDIDALRYISTRSQAPILDFDAVLLVGLARDGGLYLPEAWPAIDVSALAGLGYAEIARRVMQPFVGGGAAAVDLDAALSTAFADFGHRAVAPLKQIDDRLWLLELFHGPTLAFKDYALQVVGRLFDRVLARKNQRIVVVGATSGDTGSAAIEACRGRGNIEVFILYPHGRVSEVQRRQMTTADSPNVHAIAIEGSFDDCQGLVKAMFNDAPFRDRHRLSAVNSINWARILAQIVYYVSAAVALGAPGRRVAFSVPTGNFGNVFAAYAATRIGLPVERLIVASNRNDILQRFFASGVMEVRGVEPSWSPSMDIQISSNFERVLFESMGRDGTAVAAVMDRFRAEGRFAAEPSAFVALRRLFSGFRLDDEGTLEVVRRTHRRTGEIVDPHTAIGIAAAEAADVAGSVPIVTLATAHPAKFPDAVERAIGERPALPARLADLYQRTERTILLPNDLRRVQDHIAGRLAAEGRAA
jgi:threonine synthase